MTQVVSCLSTANKDDVTIVISYDAGDKWVITVPYPHKMKHKDAKVIWSKVS